MRPGRALPRAAMPLEGARRDEKPVAGTRWPVKRRQGSSYARRRDGAEADHLALLV